MLSAEMLIGNYAVQTLGISVSQIKGISSIYMMGVLVSKLFSLFLVYMVRVFVGKNKHESDRRFNLLMAIMPIQSIVLCFIVYRYSVNNDMLQTSALGLIAVTISLFLVFIFMLVLRNQRTALEYKKDYELAQASLRIQIEYHQKLYEAQHEVRSIQHEMRTNLIAISGSLSDGLVDESLARINRILDGIKRTENVVETGLPAVDAVLSAKLAKANESGIKIVYKVMIDSEMSIDQFDLSVIVANSLDNAIEGIERSNDVDRRILMSITSESDYIQILVENPTVEPIGNDFGTSKTDKTNHGFGIPQMRAIAQKYDGCIQAGFNTENKRYLLNILLKSPRN